MPSVGTSVRRAEGREKVRGTAKYIDDYKLPGCLFGVTLRSTVPHARIRNICFDSKFPWHEFVFAKASDIPGQNVVALIEGDQPLLADTVVRHREEPILLMAHADRAKAYEALKHVTVDYEPLPAVTSLDQADRPSQPWFGPDNVFKRYHIRKGDATKGLAKADLVVEGEYRVPHQEQAYIENNGVAAYVDQDGSVVVMGSMQCPFYVQKALIKAFNLPPEKVRVIQTVTGGGFGGKEEYPSMIAGHAALLALKAGRPVKIIYDRHEDMAATTKRHPAIVRHKTGVMKDGRIVAQKIEVVMDGGAYCTLSPVVLSRGTLHASGPYDCPNVEVVSRCVATNTPPNGAFRGFGAPQTLFAAELHMEKIARTLGISSLELRRKNLFKTGSITATGQVLKESVGASECLETVVKRSGYLKKRQAFEAWNKKKSGTKRGIGLAVVHHGAGFTGSGETMLASKAGVRLDADGRVFVLAASTEIGQGANTVFTQICADALGAPVSLVRVETPDTSKVPNSGPTVASRTTMIVGGLVKRAAERLKADLLARAKRVPQDLAGMRKAAAALLKGAPSKTYEVQYEAPPGLKWDDKLYAGDAYPVFSYAAMAVEVEIDGLTREVAVRGVWTAHDVGKAVNPALAEGQIIGGLTQGLGYALLEVPVYKDGGMVNAQLTNYVIPTSLDAPEFDVVLVEKPFSHAPFGAKGLGELPMDVPGPAVAAAVYHATGLFVTELPITPERLS